MLLGGLRELTYAEIPAIGKIRKQTDGLWKEVRRQGMIVPNHVLHRTESPMHALRLVFMPEMKRLNGFT